MSSRLAQFEAGELDPAAFDHAFHIEVAVALLRTTEFSDAVRRYLDGLRTMAEAAGAPEKVNVTITIAFLSLVAERLDREPADLSAAEFLEHYPELRSSQVLKRWYAPARLHSELARAVFLLPSSGDIESRKS